MKKTLIILVTFIAFSCKKEASEKITTPKETVEVLKEDSSIKTLEGEFLYYADAAVLKTKTEVYGVVLDAKMQELANQVAPLKKSDTDMVVIVIKGKIVPKDANEEGWPFNIIIKEIIEVKQVAKNDSIIIKK